MVRAKKDIIARFSTLEICHTRLIAIGATTHDSRIETTATSRKDYTPSLFGNFKPRLHFTVIARETELVTMMTKSLNAKATCNFKDSTPNHWSRGFDIFRLIREDNGISKNAVWVTNTSGQKPSRPQVYFSPLELIQPKFSAGSFRINPAQCNVPHDFPCVSVTLIYKD